MTPPVADPTPPAWPSAAALRPALWVHYMPWFGTKAARGRWGWHWTLGKRDPEQRRPDGRRDIAAHDYPLIGPYDSADPHVLECQVLLMQAAGLAGVIVDWYGRAEFDDHAVVHRNTEALLPWLRRAGLRFAVCYEDQAVGHRVRRGAIRAEEARAEGLATLRWLEEHWFADPAYWREAGRPVLLVFGPQYFERADWAAMESALAVRPRRYALAHRAEPTGAEGLFGWPPVEAGKTLAPAAWQQRLRQLYARQTPERPVLPVAFPGFRDFYREAGLHDSYGRIEPRDGATLAESLALARATGAPAIQVATWNDYGEGTVVEPTQEDGYRHLELLQAEGWRQERPAAAPVARPWPADLRLPVRLWERRQRHAGDLAAQARCDAIAALLFARRYAEARRALAD